MRSLLNNAYRDAESDLQEVLANGGGNLHALPQSNGTPGATDNLLSKYKKNYEELLTNKEKFPSIEDVLNNKIHDTKKIVATYIALRNYYGEEFAKDRKLGTNDDAIKMANRNFDRFLEYLTIKERIKFEKDNSQGIDANDSPVQIKAKIAEKNRQFQQDMNKHKQAIFSKINIKLKENNVPPVNSKAIRNTTEHMRRVFETAANYTNKLLTQKNEINQRINEIYATIEETNPTKSRDNLKAQREKLEAELKPILDQHAENTPARKALEWKIEDIKLHAKWQRNSTAENREALKKHHSKDNVDAYNKQHQHITGQLQQARSILTKINNITQQEEITQSAVKPYEVASNEATIEQCKGAIANKLGLSTPEQVQQVQNKIDKLAVSNEDYKSVKKELHEAAKLQTELNAEKLALAKDIKKEDGIDEKALTEIQQKINNLVGKSIVFEEDEKFQKAATLQTKINAIKTQLKTELKNKDNKDKSLDEIQQEIDERSDENYADTEVNGYLNEAVELQQAVNKDLPAVKDDPCYQLAKNNFEYRSQMQGIAANLQNNPNPTQLAAVQANMNNTSANHQNKINKIHTTAGSDKLLAKVSAPLKALRNTMHRSVPSALRHPLGQTQIVSPNHQQSARLPVLKYEDYDLEKIPNPVKDVHVISGSVNKLLEERELLERQLQSNPELAKNGEFNKKVTKNTDDLQQRMVELRKGINRSATYLRTNRNINEYIKKTARLYDAILSSERLARARRGALATAGNGGLIGRAIRGLRPSLEGGINTSITYDPNMGKQLENTSVLTKYYVQDGLFKWRVVDLTVKIKHRGAGGHETEIEEMVKFNEAELMEHFEDFCKEHGIRDQVTMKRSSSTVVIFWPARGAKNPNDPTEYKRAWLNYLKKKYTEKREAELNKPAHEAEVDVDRPKGAALASARPVTKRELARALNSESTNADIDQQPSAISLRN